MAKHLYSPRITEVWKEVEATLDAEETLTPHMKQVVAGAISRLEERDQQLEDALLGDLVVNNVSGTVGTIPTSQARQLGWSSNFGFYSGSATDAGLGDGTQNMTVPYGQGFLTDTVVVMPCPVTVGGAQSAFPFLRSANKNGFVVGIHSSAPATPTPLAITYLAFGF